MKISNIIIFILFFIANFSMAQTRVDSIHATNYTINLSIIDFSNKIIEGNTQIKIVSKVNNLNTVRLDLMSFSIDSTLVNNENSSFTHNGNTLLIEVPTLQNGDSATITVFYRGTPSYDDNFGGFYYSGEYAYNVGVALHDQPHNYGRCWFPC